MHYTLDILDRHHEYPPPLRTGQLVLSVARHDDAPEMYAAHVDERSRLVQELADIDGVEIEDWGYADTEVRDVILELTGVGLTAFATIVSSWIPMYYMYIKDKKVKKPAKHEAGVKQPAAHHDSVAGYSIQKADGSLLKFTMREDTTPEQRKDILTQFLAS